MSEMDGSAIETGEVGVEESSSSEGSASPVGNKHLHVDPGTPGSDAPESLGGTANSERDDRDTSTPTGDVAAAPVASSFWKFRNHDGSEREFKSPDEAQQFFSSWNGRLSKAERELRDAEKANYEWQEAYESGKLAEYYAKNKQGGQTSAQEEKPVHPTQELLSKLDREYVTGLLKKGDAVKALEYITYVNSQFFNERLDQYKQEFEGKIDELVAPSRFAGQVQNGLNYIAESEHQAVDDYGQPKYPEFVDGPQYDKSFVHHFRDIWLAQQWQDALTPQGFRLAYLEAKHTYRPAPVSQDVTSAEEAKNVAADMVRDAQGRFVQRRQALAMSTNDVAKGRPDTSPKSREQNILDGMRNAATRKSKHFNVHFE